MYKWKLGLLWGFLLVAHTVRAGHIKITNEAGLRDLATEVNRGNSYSGDTIYLTNDIQLTEGNPWTPIGTEANPFVGHFEGWGHKISGLSIPEGSNYQGLFGYIRGGSVRDVAVVGTSSVTGGHYVGAICGYLDVGEISSCYSEADVTGTTYVGGICGSSTGKIRDCYVSGRVTSTATEENVNVGGIVGYLSGTLQYCYMSGTMSISGSAYYGGIVGYIHGQSTLSNCIYDSALKTSSIYAVGSDSGSSDSNLISKSAEDMKKKATWTGILNTETYNIAWKIEDESYPQLYSFLKNEPITFSLSGPGAHWQTIVPNGNYHVPDDMRAYIVVSVSELTPETPTRSGTVMLRSVTTLNEGRGAIVYFYALESDFTPVVGESENIVTRTAQTTTGQLDDYSDDNWLKGSHVSPVAIGGESAYEDYILANQNSHGYAFYRAMSGSLRRGKAFIRLNATSSSSRGEESHLSIVIEGETTPVGEIVISGDGTAVYDFYGHRLPSAPSHGLYIQNGKKIWRR